MKKLLVVSAVAALGLTSAAFAGGLPEDMPMAPMAVSSSDVGVYLGISGGYGMTNWENLEFLSKASKDKGVVGRAFAGYDFDRYFAVELGYTHFFNKVELAGSHGYSGLYEIKTSAVDLVGKLKAPVADGVDFYAKLGVNYLISSVDDKVAKNTAKTNNFNVAYGAGIDYSITPNIIANVEWMRFGGHAKLKSLEFKDYQPFVDVFMVGLRYKFDM